MSKACRTFFHLFLISTCLDSGRKGLRRAYPLSELLNSSTSAHDDDRFAHFSYPPLQLLSGSSFVWEHAGTFLSHPRHTQRFFAVLPVATMLAATHFALIVLLLLGNELCWWELRWHIYPVDKHRYHTLRSSWQLLSGGIQLCNASLVSCTSCCCRPLSSLYTSFERTGILRCSKKYLSLGVGDSKS